MKTLHDIFTTALEIEKEGAKLYKRSASHAINPLTAATFSFLASEEIKHIKIFTEYIETKKLADTTALRDSHINPKNEIQKIFDEKISRDFNQTINIMHTKSDVYEKALEIEERSYNLYKSALTEVTGNEEKKFLEFLCAQENEHYTIIQESKEFLDNPGDWFAKEERWMQT